MGKQEFSIVMGIETSLRIPYILPAIGAPGLTPILAPGDYIIAIDSDGIVSNSSYPEAESPDTKYLNFGGPGSGFIVTPSAPAQVRSFQMTTVNDVPGLDPASWQLFSTNSPISSVDNSTGEAEPWSLIDSGLITLPGIGGLALIKRRRQHS